MGSQLLPQTLLMVPRNPTQSPCHVNKLGFFLSRTPSPLVTAHVSVSGFRLNNPVGSISSAFSTRDFVVRAESTPEGEVEADEASSEEAEVKAESGEEAEAEEGLKGEVEEVEEDENAKEPREPRKPRIKLGEIMGILNTRAIEASQTERPIPDLRTGDIVEIKFEAPQTRRRLSIYKGIVMSKQNAGLHTTIRIRRIIAGIGVEIVFPVYSPNIKEIKVVKHRKVRKARLYYLREKLPRFSTFK